MAQAPLRRPTLFKDTSDASLTLDQKQDGGNSFSYQQFVTLTSDLLAQTAAAAATGIYGLTVDQSHTPTDEPYTQPFGEFHSPIDLRNTTFVMNTSVSGVVGTGLLSSGNLVVGNYYPIAYLTTVDTGAATINTATAGTTVPPTTLTGGILFQVVGKYLNITEAGGVYSDGDLLADTNGRVLVKVATFAIQA